MPLAFTAEIPAMQAQLAIQQADNLYPDEFGGQNALFEERERVCMQF